MIFDYGTGVLTPISQWQWIENKNQPHFHYGGSRVSYLILFIFSWLVCGRKVLFWVNIFRPGPNGCQKSTFWTLKVILIYERSEWMHLVFPYAHVRHFWNNVCVWGVCVCVCVCVCLVSELTNAVCMPVLIENQNVMLRTVKTIVIHLNETVEGSTCLLSKTWLI